MDNIEYRDECIGSHSGQTNMELGLYINDEIIGMVQYVLYDGELSVSDIIVRPEYRRKGYGSKMMQHIKKQHPEYKYKSSMKTELGSKFKHKEMKEKYILSRKNFFKLNENDNLNKSVDGLVKYGMESPIKKLEIKLANTNDLWEIDKIGSELEGMGEWAPGGSVTSEDYTKFHRETIPAWIKKHWMVDMEFDEQDLKKLLYDDYIPKFEEHIEELGYKSQEVFVSYEVGSTGDESEDYTDYSEQGLFKIGFDIFKESEEESESGWIVFQFHIANSGGINIKDTIEHKSGDTRPYRVNDVTSTMKIGEGTFNTFKIESPYNNLADYFGDGGYILRNN